MRNVENNTNTIDDLKAQIRDLQARIDSREQTATQRDTVYDVCRVDESNYGTFIKVCDALHHDGKAVRNISDKHHKHHITGNAKNWVANAGGKAKFLELTKAFVYDGGDPYVPTKYDTNVLQASVPDMVATYLSECDKVGKGFTTTCYLEETGSFKGTPFGIIQTGDKRYVVGKVIRPHDKVQRIKHTRWLYRDIDQQTKGQRAKCDIVVFEPRS